MKSFIAWVGGKSRLAKTIVKKIPDHQVYVEVFGGAGWVLFEKSPESSKVEVYNDLNGDLVNLFRVVKHRPSAFNERLELIPYSRKIYRQFQKDLGRGRMDEVDQAVKFYYCVKSAFGANVRSGWARGNTRNFIFKKDNFINEISQRITKVYIEHLDFRRLIPLWDSPEAFFYVDPPYTMTDRSHYRYFLDDGGHRELRDLLSGIQGKFLLSYDDSKVIRGLYKGLNIRRVKSVRYSMNNKNGGTRKPEL